MHNVPHRPRFVKPVRAKIRSPAPCADKEKPGIQRISGFGNDIRIDQRLENCGARRAALRPYSINFFAFSPVFSRISVFCLAVFPYELTHQLSRFFFTICAESLVYYRCQFSRLIVLHLGVNVHSHLAVLVPSQILDSLRINAFMNQIRDIGVPEKMRRHIEI